MLVVDLAAQVAMERIAGAHIPNRLPFVHFARQGIVFVQSDTRELLLDFKETDFRNVSTWSPFSRLTCTSHAAEAVNILEGRERVYEGQPRGWLLGFLLFAALDAVLACAARSEQRTRPLAQAQLVAPGNVPGDVRTLAAMSNRGYAMVRRPQGRYLASNVAPPRGQRLVGLGLYSPSYESFVERVRSISSPPQEHGYCHVWAQCYANERHPSWCKARRPDRGQPTFPFQFACSVCSPLQHLPPAL